MLQKLSNYIANTGKTALVYKLIKYVWKICLNYIVTIRTDTFFSNWEIQFHTFLTSIVMKILS